MQLHFAQLLLTVISYLVCAGLFYCSTYMLHVQPSGKN